MPDKSEHRGLDKWHQEQRAARRKEAKLQAVAFFERDQFDPDCWFDIPDLGVKPADVDFDGFAGAILYPKNPHLTEPIRGLVRTARALLRRDGISTMREVLDLELEFLDLAEASPEGPGEGAAPNQKQSAAWCYRTIMFDLERIGMGRWAAQDDLAAIAFAADLLADWATQGSVAAERQRAGASKGGRKSGETRRSDAVNAVAVIRAARARGWPAIDWGIREPLAQRFGCSSRRIGQILAAARESRK